MLVIKNMKFIFTQKNKKGFTLVETLVAISIFTTSILALTSVLANGISNTGFAKRKIIASYLAQEGVEYIRNMRDTYVVYDTTSSQNGWNAFNTKIAGGVYPLGTSICASGSGCYFDDKDLYYSNQAQPIINIPVYACSGVCPHLFYHATTGKYNYDNSGTNSVYTRKITVSQTSTYETKITSTVSWTQGSGSQNVTFSLSLFNWIE